jgi:hypothetical protein
MLSIKTAAIKELMADLKAALGPEKINQISHLKITWNNGAAEQAPEIEVSFEPKQPVCRC